MAEEPGSWWIVKPPGEQLRTDTSSRKEQRCRDLPDLFPLGGSPVRGGGISPYSSAPCQSTPPPMSPCRSWSSATSPARPLSVAASST
jgi:hypothetical protein